MTNLEYYSVMFLKKTKKALKTMNLDTYIPSGGQGPGTLQSQQLRNIGSITISSMTYDYCLGNIAPENNRTELRVKFIFTSANLKDGKMSMKIYEGFTFDGFTSRDYTTANVTTRFTYPHQKEFDKHKFQDAMVGDTLLAGIEQDDGTIVPDNTLKLTGDNLPDIITDYLPLLQALKNQKLDVNACVVLVKGAPGVGNHTIEHKTTPVNNVVFRKVNNDTEFTVNFKNQLINGVYSYDFVISSEHNGGFYVYMNGDCGENGYEVKTLYRFWASDVNNNGKEYSRKPQAYTRSGYFLRGAGKNVQFKGSFHYTGNKLNNKGKPFSLNVDSGDNKGKTYEFLVQDLQGKTGDGSSQVIFGTSLTFVIKPDTGTLDLKSDSYFLISANTALAF